MPADLWSDRRDAARRAVEPLAARMRPISLDEIAGQTHILGPGRLLTRMLDAGTLSSIILHGPPGTGKTTLAGVIASHTRARLVRENAASVGVSRIREIIADAARRIEENAGRTILFLDEIHRFSKAQQDVLLGDVERGTIILIGATTENPLFAVNSALVSRSTLFRLEPLSEDDIRGVLRRAVADRERGLGAMNISIDDDALDTLARLSDGDARRALTALEIAANSAPVAARLSEPCAPPVNNKNCDTGVPSGTGVPPVRKTPSGTGVSPVRKTPSGTGVSPVRKTPSGTGVPPVHDKPGAPAVPPVRITAADARDSIQRKALIYSRDGDEHYDLASALIKSLRGSDPDAAVYWLARMLEAGEDPRFIARRLAILASEDIGNADPHAVTLAAACWTLVERIGMPEARITLSQCATYLALAPKSNAAYRAIDDALADVRTGATIPVPLFLRDPHKPDSAGSAKHGEGYKYSHTRGAETSVGGVTDQQYLGVEKTYYHPTARGHEQTHRERLDEIISARSRSAEK